MKIFLMIFCFIIVSSMATAKEMSFTGSTPAATVIRSFLGISLSDSVDFIRWKLTFKNNRYLVNCNYGISKPNTAGFINDGNKINLADTLLIENNIFLLKNGNKVLKMIMINNFLIHILNTDNSMLVGNGGWSYTLNAVNHQQSRQLTLKTQAGHINDSIIFQGRTPCDVPGIIPKGKLCYKLKWYIVLYADVKQNQAGTYRLYGTPYRKEGGRRGTWKTVTGSGGEIVYELNNEKEEAFIHLLKLDENILIFTDAVGNLLTGDEDFSYTLNKVSHNDN